MEMNSCTQLLLLTALFLFNLLPSACQVSQVTCGVERCVLPCAFTPASEVVIHWMKQGELVHSFYHSQEQLERQVEGYSNRTALFLDQISQGTASLQIRPVRVQDEGTYRCYTSTVQASQQTYVELKVRAPLHSVHLRGSDTYVNCSCERVYPKPSLSWSTIPHSQAGDLNVHTWNSSDTQGLYTLVSSVYVEVNTSAHTYICSAVSEDGTHNWTASLRLPGNRTLDSGSSSVTLSCDTPALSPELTHTVVNRSWLFSVSVSTEAHTILTQHAGDVTPQVYDGWQSQKPQLLENNSLELHNLQASQHDGIYTCMLSGPGNTHLVQTRLVLPQGFSPDGGHMLIVVIAVIVVGVFIVFAVLFILLKKRRHANYSSPPRSMTD